MNSETNPIYIATRGSALALAQANMIMARCRDAFPDLQFALKIIKTTGDKLQTASMAQEGHALPKGLFTKELEVALLNREASLAVHSLKDLPTDLPEGLTLGAVSKRADVRDVLIYRSNEFAERGTHSSARAYQSGLTIQDLPAGAAVATSSTRRKAQLLSQNAGLKVPDIRGNVATRLRKLMDNPELDATVLALAGISRLNFQISPEGKLNGDGIPEGLLATVLDIDTMLPCVGQGAIGIEVRKDDDFVARICEKLNDYETYQSVAAERAFLSGMGGGCQSPVAAYARRSGEALELTALSFADGPVRKGSATMPFEAATELGRQMAERLRG
jgi:hydroxymethylbilane synthase